MTKRTYDGLIRGLARVYSRSFDGRFGFFVLAGAPTVLFVLAVLGSMLVDESVPVAVVLVALSAAMLRGLRIEWDRLLADPDPDVSSVPQGVRSVVAVVAGAVVTLAVTAEFGLSPIVAAGLTAVLGGLVDSEDAVAIYCGAFVGMTSPDLFTTYSQALLAGFLAGGVFALCRPAYDGVGGKLGTTAFVAATAVVALTAAEFHSDPLPGAGTSALVVSYSILGAVVTYVLSVRRGWGPVLASGTVGVVGGVTMPVLHPVTGWMLAAAVFCASFVGMASEERLPGVGRIALAGLVAGLVFVYTTPYLGGSGGKLGTIAFGSCLAVVGLDTWLLGRRSRYDGAGTH
ncbi:hypothetical protein [Natronorarus salvus]|uniref:hypothetical protein n=1 Tax=Natronorarus salvus TaxID=3117733 RepID=UPI002F26D7E8